MLKSLFILLTFICLGISVCAQQVEVKRTECRVEADPKVESNRVFVCFDEDTEKQFAITIGANHLWAKYLEDTQLGVSTVVIEGRGNQVCLMQVKPLDDLVKHPVNERINACLTVKRANAKLKR